MHCGVLLRCLARNSLVSVRFKLLRSVIVRSSRGCCSLALLGPPARWQFRLVGSGETGRQRKGGFAPYGEMPVAQGGLRNEAGSVGHQLEGDVSRCRAGWFQAAVDVCCGLLGQEGGEYTGAEWAGTIAPDVARQARGAAGMDPDKEQPHCSDTGTMRPRRQMLCAGALAGVLKEGYFGYSGGGGYCLLPDGEGLRRGASEFGQYFGSCGGAAAVVVLDGD